MIKKTLLLFMIIILIIPVIINYTNINFAKNTITQMVSEVMGRRLKLNGDLKIQLYPNTGLSAENIQFENAQWSEQDYLLEAKSINIKISAKALFTGKIDIIRIILDGFIINLEKNDFDKANWEFRNLVKQKSKSNKSNELVVLPFYRGSKLSITNASINYKDKNIEKNIYIKELHVEQSENTEIRLLARHKDVPVKIYLKIPAVNNLLNLSSIPIVANGNIGNIDFSVETDLPVSRYDNLDILFDVKYPDLTTIKKLFPVDNYEIGKVLLNARIIKQKQNYIVKISTATIDKTLISGYFEYRIQPERPKVIARLKIKLLNLTKLKKLISSNSKTEINKAESEELFPSKTLPFKNLFKYDADIDIDIEGIEDDLLELVKFTMNAKLEDGLLNVNKLTVVNNRDEEITAKIRINSQTTQPEMNVIFVTENIQLDENDTLKQYLSGANTNIKINLDSKGESVQKIMDHLNGQIIVKIGKAELDDDLLKFVSSNILTDLVKAINPIADKSPKTNLECAVIRFDIKEGVLTADRGVVMQTDKIQIISSGIVDLHSQTLEFGIRPQAREGVELNLNSLASMVKLSGKIIDPSITMSVKDTAIVYSYFASGGATFLVKSLYDTATRDASPCETAIMGPMGAN